MRSLTRRMSRGYGNALAVRTTKMCSETLEPRTFLSASTLDTSFNGTGKVLATFGTGASFQSVVTLPNGKVLAAGTVQNGTRMQDFLVAKYNANGTPDTSFGGGTGRVFTDFGSTNDTASKLLLLSGGKFLVVGNSSLGGGNFSVARYNANGSLDTSFSSDGKVTVDFGGGHFDRAATGVLLSDGKLLIVGNTDAPDPGPIVAMARITTAGTLDTSFGGGTGKKTLRIGNTFNYPVDAAVLPGGQILLALDDRFTLARLTSSGNLDTSFFGGSGFIRAELAGQDEPTCLKVLSSGKILIGGSSCAVNEFTDFPNFAIMRFNERGTIDTSFGPEGNGYTMLDFDSSNTVQSYDHLRDMWVQPNGKIFAAGVVDRVSSSGESFILGMARFNANGTVDTSFSGDGKLEISGVTAANAIVAAPGGKAVVAGYAGTKAALLRFGSDFAATASIAGTVYNDSNGNGTKNTGEAGLSAWQVFVDSNNDGFYTAGETVATTDSSGNYKLTGLLPGAYRIREVRLSDWNRTQPAGIYPLGYYDITLGVGQAVTGKNFGNKHA